MEVTVDMDGLAKCERYDYPITVLYFQAAFCCPGVPRTKDAIDMVHVPRVQQLLGDIPSFSQRPVSHYQRIAGSQSMKILVPLPFFLQPFPLGWQAEKTI